MAITPGGQNVVNEKMSGKLKSKLMKTDECCVGKCENLLVLVFCVFDFFVLHSDLTAGLSLFVII